MTLSPFPPLAGRSYTANALKPIFNFEAVPGCGATLLNRSAPVSIRPSFLRSRTSQAVFAPAAVHGIWIGRPVPKKSNLTPFWALVSWNPVPFRSMTIGSTFWQVPSLQLPSQQSQSLQSPSSSTHSSQSPSPPPLPLPSPLPSPLSSLIEHFPLLVLQ